MGSAQSADPFFCSIAVLGACRCTLPGLGRVIWKHILGLRRVVEKDPKRASGGLTGDDNSTPKRGMKGL